MEGFTNVLFCLTLQAKDANAATKLFHLVLTLEHAQR